MGFENKYPYTDFHEMNLDWILEVVKRLESEWPEFKTTLETEWNEYKDELTGENGEWPTFKTQIETIVNNFIHDVVGNYNGNLDYQPGMFCYYEGNVYKCTTGSSAAFPRPFSAYGWFSYAGQNTNSIVNDLFNYLTDTLNGYDNEIYYWIQHTAAQWDETTAYKAGDYCSAYVGGFMTPSSWRYYRCLQDCTNVNVLDTNYWKEVIFASDVTETIAAYKQAMQDQYDQFLEDYQRTFGVVQTRGSSTTDVMSQKAVSDELQAYDDMIDNLIKDIAPVYDSTKAYKIGNLLTYLGKQYYCIADAPAGTLPTNTTYFEEKSVADIIEMIKAGEITVGKANLANNFDSKMVLTDNSGYLCRTTGGSLEVGEQNRVKKIIGASVPIIQMLDVSQASTETINDVVFTNNNDGTWKVNGTATGGSATKLIYTIELTGGHRYFLQGCPSGGGDTSYKLRINYGGSARANDYGSGAFWSPSSTVTVYIYISLPTGSTATNKIFKPNLIDLTQTFGKTVADRLYTLEQAQAGTGIAKAKEILVKDYYPYNVTAFTHTKTTGKQNVGFNLFDADTYFAANGFTHESDGSWKRNGNNQALQGKTIWANESGYDGRIQVVCQSKNADTSTQGLRLRTYYTDGTNVITYFTATTSYTSRKITTTNGKIVSKIVWDYGGTTQVTYFKDFCIDFYWDGERDGEYEDYQEWNYPVQDIELKGILSLDAQDNWVADGDEYLPSGVVDENYYEYTVTGNETMDFGQWVDNAITIYLNAPVKHALPTYNPYIKCSKHGYMMCTYTNDANYFYFVDATSQFADLDAFKSYIAGAKILFKLSNPTSTTADSYTELQNDSNWGTEKWIDTRDVPMPVFSTCEYIPDLKAKLETAPESPDEDGDYIMHRENGLNSYGSLSTWLSANGYNKLQDLLTTFGANGMVGGTLRSSLASAKSIAFNNTACVSLSSLSWAQDTVSTLPVFKTTSLASLIAKPGDTNAPNILCTFLEPNKYSDILTKDNSIFVGSPSGTVYVRCSRYSTVTELVEAIKGQLFAYEKAST